MTPPVVPSPEANAAARWWADKLTNGPDGGVTASATSLRKRFSREQADRFAAALVALIDDRLSAEMQIPAQTLPMTIECDYRLHPVLADAAWRAGLLVSMYDLPLRAQMLINFGRVTVCEGRRAPEAVVWVA